VQSVAAFRLQLQASGTPAAPLPETAVLGSAARVRWLARLPLRALAYGLFAVAASAFSAWPAFDLMRPGEAMISLAFSHAGQRLGECRRLSQAELDKLPPNMRKPTDCPRERRPVLVVFSVDQHTLYQRALPPSGIWNDGESTIYARFPVPQGEHLLHIGMSDSGREAGFDFQLETQVVLQPEQHLVVEFDDDKKAFILR
jgi:hypothetical protein